MQISRMELDKQAIEERGEIPEQGDWIDVNDTPHLIRRVNIVNGSKVELLLEPDRPVKEYDDPEDPSVDWDPLEV